MATFELKHSSLDGTGAFSTSMMPEKSLVVEGIPTISLTACECGNSAKIDCSECECSSYCSIECSHKYSEAHKSICESVRKLTLIQEFKEFKNAVFFVSLNSVRGRKVVPASGFSFIRRGIRIVAEEVYKRLDQITQDVYSSEDFVSTVNTFSLLPNFHPALSKFNHSCFPNAILLENGKVYTIRPIQANEEITISYLDRELSSAPLGARRLALEATFGFECKCTVCTPGNAQNWFEGLNHGILCRSTKCKRHYIHSRPILPSVPAEEHKPIQTLLRDSKSSLVKASDLAILRELVAVNLEGFKSKDLTDNALAQGSPPFFLPTLLPQDESVIDCKCARCGNSFAEQYKEKTLTLSDGKVVVNPIYRLVTEYLRDFAYVRSSGTLKEKFVSLDRKGCELVAHLEKVAAAGVSTAPKEYHEFMALKSSQGRIVVAAVWGPLGGLPMMSENGVAPLLSGDCWQLGLPLTNLAWTMHHEAHMEMNHVTCDRKDAVSRLLNCCPRAFALSDVLFFHKAHFIGRELWMAEKLGMEKSKLGPLIGGIALQHALLENDAPIEALPGCVCGGNNRACGNIKNRTPDLFAVERLGCMQQGLTAGRQIEQNVTMEAILPEQEKLLRASYVEAK